MNMKIGAVLLAAGRSERFGSDKLLAGFAGKPMICRALETMSAFPAARKCVIAGSDQVAALSGEYGFSVICNSEPQLGQSYSIRLGVAAMQDLDAVLLMVADQPGLTQASLARLAEAFAAAQKGIACLRDETHMGNPAIFAKAYFPQLLALEGDRGAKGILKAHPEDLMVVPCAHRGELADADTPQQLETMESAQNK